MGHHDLFFQARYFDQILVSLHDVGTLEQSTMSFMCLLCPIWRHHFRDDTCLMHMLLHKFMVHLMPHRADAMIAYELLNLGVWDHLLFQGHQACLPPWLEVNDLLLYVTPGLDPPNIRLGVIRKVKRLPHLWTQDDEEEDMEEDQIDLYVEKVYLSKLQSIRGGFNQYKAKITSWWYVTKCRCSRKHVACSGHVTRLAQNLLVEWESVEVQWSTRMLRNAYAKCNKIAPSYYSFPSSCVLMHHFSYVNLIHKIVNHHKERKVEAIINFIHQKALATCQIW